MLEHIDVLTKLRLPKIFRSSEAAHFIRLHNGSFYTSCLEIRLIDGIGRSGEATMKRIPEYKYIFYLYEVDRAKSCEIQTFNLKVFSPLFNVVIQAVMPRSAGVKHKPI